MSDKTYITNSFNNYFLNVDKTLSKNIVSTGDPLSYVNSNLTTIFVPSIQETDPTISAYTWWNRQATNDACKSRSLLSRQSTVRLSGVSASGQLAAAELILNSTKKPAPAPSDGGRHRSESRAYCPVSLSSMCPRRHQSRSKLPVHQMNWMGACEMFRTLKCSTVSEK